jgi:lipopolysaccharide biosynthesis glycosyltransferase
MLASVAAHCSGVTAHWICSGLSRSDSNRLVTYFAARGLTLRFYLAIDDVIRSLPVDKHASLANYYRLMAPALLPQDVDRVIYLDSDLIVRKDLSDLWHVDLSGAPIGAVYEPAGSMPAGKLGLRLDDYFNSGVMLVDLAHWRRVDLGARVVEYILQHSEKVTYWDQDGLNGVLRGHWCRIPARWNVTHGFFQRDELQGTYQDEIRDPAIVHFSGQGLKPWQYRTQHPFKSEYRMYRRQTPWPRYREEGAPSISERAKRHLRSISWLRRAKSLLDSSSMRAF